jgi:RNA polymerase sigma-70 factor (family 1)
MAFNQDTYAKFEALFREHYNALSNYAFSVLRNRQDAEDVVQDIFIRIWQNSPHVIEDPKVKFYLFTAVKNGCISFLRKQAGKTYLQPEEAGLQSLDDKLPDPAPQAVHDIAALVNQALALLPPQCRAIFKLSRFGQLTYAQIAEELNLSVKTVENQVGKALRIMRDYAKKNNISFSLLILLLFECG